MVLLSTTRKYVTQKIWKSNFENLEFFITHRDSKKSTLFAIQNKNLKEYLKKIFHFSTGTTYEANKLYFINERIKSREFKASLKHWKIISIKQIIIKILYSLTIFLLKNVKLVKEKILYLK